jgi:hypothetical protein
MWPFRKRQVEIMYPDGETDVISPYLLNTYIQTGKIVRFKRGGYWVLISKGPMRGQDGRYKGRERRRA